MKQFFNDKIPIQLNRSSFHRSFRPLDSSCHRWKTEPLQIHANSHRQEKSNIACPNPSNNGRVKIPGDKRNFSLLTLQLTLFTIMRMPTGAIIAHEKVPTTKEIGKCWLTRSANYDAMRSLRVLLTRSLSREFREAIYCTPIIRILIIARYVLYCCCTLLFLP